MSKVNFNALRRLVDEAEKFATNALAMKSTSEEEFQNKTVELAKAMGLLMGISGEASALMKDLQVAATTPSTLDSLSDLMGLSTKTVKPFSGKGN